MNFITDANGNVDAFLVVIVIAVLIIVFFVSREINIWYWKINEFKKSQDEQIRLLKKIAGEDDDSETEDS